MPSASPVVVTEEAFHAGHIFEPLSEIHDCAIAVGAVASMASNATDLLKVVLRRALLLEESDSCVSAALRPDFAILSPFNRRSRQVKIDSVEVCNEVFQTELFPSRPRLRRIRSKLRYW